MLLRSRFLGGVAYGPLYAADDGTAAAVPASTGSSSPSPDSSVVAATSPPGEAAAAAPGASASAPGAADSAVAAPAEAAPAKQDSPTSLLAEATAKAPGAAEEAAKPADAKPEGKPDAKADAKKAETPAPAKPKADAKPDAAKPAAEAKPADDKAPAPASEALAETPPAHTYEAFKVPDGLKLDDERVKSFTSILDDAKLAPQERGQKLVDLFVSEVQNVQTARDQHQRDVWSKLQDSWKEELRTDPDVGGNRMMTSLGLSKWVIEQLGGTKRQQGELLAQLSYTGMGNNVGLVRLLNNVAEVLSEGEVVPASPRPAKDSRSRSERWYGQNGAGS